MEGLTFNWSKLRKEIYISMFGRENIEHVREQKRVYREYNGDEIRANKRRYYLETRTYSLTRARTNRNNIKIKILTHYGGGKCACVQCGESRPACLSIDHIDGNGNRHRKILKRGGNFYYWLTTNNYPEGYQTLCMNCQFVKKYINMEFRK